MNFVQAFINIFSQVFIRNCYYEFLLSFLNCTNHHDGQCEGNLNEEFLFLKIFY